MINLTRKFNNKKNYDLSCSESIIYAANEKYDLGLSENEFKMMAPFSGGMYDGDVCGIVTASISVLGLLFTNKNSHNSPLLKEVVLEYKEVFKERFSNIKCDQLVLIQRDEDTGCSDFIIDASILLEEIIAKYVNHK